MKQLFNLKKMVFVLMTFLMFNQTSLFAQTPSNGIFFQAVARDQFANPAKDRKIYVQSSIIQSTATGTKVLIEEHQTTTDGSGVFSISVGQGTRTGGTVANLDKVEWARGPYYLNLKIAITPIAPIANWNYTKDWIDLGSSPFGTVPYALYSGSSGALDDKLSVADTAKMLAIYAKAQVVNSLSTQVSSKLSATDTTTMLAPYAKMVSALVASNITSLTAASVNAALNSKVNIADSTIVFVTPLQLASKTFDSTTIYNQLGTKLNKADTSTLSNRINLKANTADLTSSLALKLNITDTNLLLQKADTSTLSNRINLKANTTDLTSGLALKLNAAEKAVANGIASLDNNSKVPANQIPVVSFQSANVVASQAAMLGLSSAVVGSIAIRTDINRNYVLSGSSPAVLANWVELAVPTSVTTVNGIPGSYVTLTTNEIGEGTINKYYTDARVRNAISATGPLNFNASTGTLSMTAASGSANGYLTSTDFNTFNNKQNTLVAGTDYATPSGNITGNAANVTGVVSIVNGGTGTTTATGALTNLGAEATANKSTATDLGNTNPSDVLFPSQKAVKTYVDLQNANAGVADLSITNAKLAGSITADKLLGSIPNNKLTNSALTIGTTNIALGATTTSLAGLSSVTATSLVGELTGNATTATTATNIAGGVSGSIPYQTAAGTTAMIPLGTSNQFLTSTGSGTYTWTSSSAVTGNSVPYTGATQSVNLGTYSITTSAVNGVYMGKGSGTGLNNTVIGNNAGGNNYLDEMTAIGAYALNAGAAGNSTAVGAYAGANNTGAYNTLIGNGAGQYQSSSIYNTALGYKSFQGRSTTPYSDNFSIDNIAIGNQAMLSHKTGNQNVAIGAFSLLGDPTGSTGADNTAIGALTLKNNNAGSRNLALGAYAGYYETGSDAFYVNNRDRTSTSLEKTSSLMYGKFDTDPALQTLTINAKLNTPYSLDVAGNITSATWSGTTIGLTKGGTGATTASDARANLGLVIGTDVMAANYTTTLTGDVTGAGSGTFATSLSNTNVTAGSYGSSTAIPTFTVDSKGRLTAASTVGIVAGVNTLNYTSTTSYAAGGTISGTSLTLTAADATNPGLISTGAQTIAGAKTFSSDVTAPTFLGNVTGTVTGNLSGTATTATNIAGGVSGSIPYQTAAGTTAMIPVGSANQLLTSTGSGTYTWTSASTVTGNFVPYTGATAAVNLGAYDLTVNGLTIGRGGGAVSSNTAVGAGAMSSTTSSATNNVAFGNNALQKSLNGQFNTVIGSDALKASVNDVGYNTVVGTSSFESYSESGGGRNTSLGAFTGKFITSGQRNVILGYYSGQYFGAGSGTNDKLTSMSNSILLGYDVRPLASGGINEVVIAGGSGSSGTIGNGSNTVTIGNNSTTGNFFKGNLTLTGNVIGGTWSGTAIANDKLANSTTTLGSTTMTLGGTVTSVTGLTSLAATNLTGTLSGTATGLATGRTISTTGDVVYTSGAFDGTTDVTGSATLTNTAVTAGSYGSSTAIPTFTVDSKGRLTAAGTVGITAGVNSLNYTSTTSYAAGGTISGTSLTLTAADATNPGLISTGAQTIAGAKTFSSDVTAPTFLGNVTGTVTGNLSGTATTATNIAGGVAGSIPYQTAAGTTSMIPVGSANQLLTSTGSGTYTWTSASTVTGNFVPYTGATAAVNLGAYDLTVNGLTIGKGRGALTDNTAIGTGTLSSTTSGEANTAIGAGALGKATSTTSNTAVGANALRDLTSGRDNTAIGSYASTRITTGQRNIAIGYSALDYITTSSDNTSVGTKSLQYNSGLNNTALGAFSLQGSNGSGGDNTAIGKDALKGVYGAAKNTALGSGSLINLTTGDENIALGYNAGTKYGSGSGTNLTNLRQGILIGSGARPLFNNSLNEVVIGYGVVGNGSNTVTIGTLSNTATYFTGDINLTGNVNGGTWSGTAIANDKLANSTTTLGSTTLTLGGTATSVTGLTSLSATNLTGTLSGTATSLATGRTIELTGDVTYTSPAFDGTGNVTAAATLAASGVSSGTYGSSTAIPTFTVDEKGRITAAGTVGITAGVNSLNYTNTASYAAGGTISGTSLTLTAADGTNPGLISTGAQTIAGSKTFNSDLVVNGMTVGKGGGNVSNNTAVGFNALTANVASGTPGINNTALGYNSLSANTTGGNNVAIGNAAGSVNVGGSNNVFIGNNANAAAGLVNNANAIAIGSNAIVDAPNKIQLGDQNITAVNTSGTITAAGFSGPLSGNATTATALATGRTIALTGDLTYTSPAFDGSGNVTAAATLAASGVASGTYGSSTAIPTFTVDSKGRITAASTVGITAGVSSLNYTTANSYAAGGTISGTSLTLAAADGTNPGLISTGAQTIAGAKTFSSDVTATNFIGNATTATTAGNITATSNTSLTSLANLTTVGTITSGVWSGTAIAVAKGGTGLTSPGTSGNILTSNGTAWVSSTPTGVNTITAIGSTANANGATIAGTSLTLQPANASFGGVVTTGTQTIAGDKTFSANIVTNGVKIGTVGGGDNVLVGGNAMNTTTTTSDRNTAIGSYSLNKITSGMSNVAVGYAALFNNTNGLEQVAIGASSLNKATSAQYNVAIGSGALSRITSGSGNTAIGTYAGKFISGGTVDNTTGSNSTFIGYNTSPLADGDDNEVVIAGGNAQNGTVGLGTNTTLIGNSATTLTRIMGTLDIPTVTESTSSTTGALKVAGGVGIAKSVTIGSATTSTSPTTGALKVAGGVGIVENLNIGGATTISNTTSSSSTTTGALKVGGGAGIVGNVYVGGTLGVTGSTALTSLTASGTSTFTTLTTTGAATFSSTVTIPTGAGVNKILTSDASGNASWNSNPNAAFKIVSTASYTVSATDDKYVIYTNAALGTISLPAITSSMSGKEIIIKNISNFNVTINANGTQKIIADFATNTVTSATLGVEASNNWVKLIADGTNSQWILFRALF